MREVRRVEELSFVEVVETELLRDIVNVVYSWRFLVGPFPFRRGGQGRMVGWGRSLIYRGEARIHSPLPPLPPLKAEIIGRDLDE